MNTTYTEAEVRLMLKGTEQRVIAEVRSTEASLGQLVDEVQKEIRSQRGENASLRTELNAR